MSQGNRFLFLATLSYNMIVLTIFFVVLLEATGIPVTSKKQKKMQVI